MKKGEQRIHFSHGVDVNGTPYTIACTANQKTTGTEFVYGITACCKEDKFDYKTGRVKALKFLDETPYSYTTINDEKPEIESIKKHLNRFVKKFEKSSVRKFIYKVRTTNSVNTPQMTIES